MSSENMADAVQDEGMQVEDGEESDKVKTITSEINTGDNDKSETNESNKFSFKCPSLTAAQICQSRIPNVLDESKNSVLKDNDSVQEKSSEKEKIESSSPQSKEVGLPNKSKETAPTFPYKEPSWSGLPEDDYIFEVLKGGIIVSNINLSKRPFTVFGRFSTCDVLMEHPSISRYHAVLQYRAQSDNEHPKGFYLYDLDSTHGTFVNKAQIRPRSYHRVHVGHIVKFGGSTKMYVLQGPAEDEEEESELTVTQIKELRQQQLAKLKAEVEKPKTEETEPSENEGVDWGLGEDAVEEISEENPFALSTANEELYLDDPKKTLRGWFEREGYELEYDVEEKGFGHFVCRVQLPIDVAGGEFVTAEASVKGKKKEAVVACALESCRILDRYGLLRQSHQEARKRKQKNWEEDDFYESDEDIYLDRTGTIEKKREMRKKMVKKDDTVETYDSLVQKLESVNNELHEIHEKLSQAQHHKESAQPESSELDSLDAYMTSLTQGEPVDKKTKSKLRLQLAQLQQEHRRLTKMIELARPVSLPSFDSRISTPGQSTQGSGKPGGSNRFLALTGSMKGHTSLKAKKQSDKPKPIPKPSDASESNVNEEEEEDDSDHDKESAIKDSDSKLQETASLNTDNGVSVSETTTKTSHEEKKVIGPSLPPNVDEKPTEALPKKKKHNKKKFDDTKCEYDTSNPDYAMWMPPENQSGDGITSLNAKYGY